MNVPVVLTKGGRVDLSKHTPSLRRVRIGLGWEPNTTDTGKDYDLDVTAFGLKGGKCVDAAHMLFYNSVNRTKDGIKVVLDHRPYHEKEGHPCTPGLELIHSGDNCTGQGKGDDETIIGDAAKILALWDEIPIIITINEAKERCQNFGQVPEIHAYVYDDETGLVIAKFDIADGFSSETAVHIGSLYRNSEGNLGFKTVGTGYNAGLDEFVKKYGL